MEESDETSVDEEEVSFDEGVYDMKLEFDTKAKINFGREEIEHDVIGILFEQNE